MPHLSPSCVISRRGRNFNFLSYSDDDGTEETLLSSFVTNGAGPRVQDEVCFVAEAHIESL